MADALPAQDAAPGRTLSGRALLSGGAAQLAAATVRQVLEQAQRTAGSVALQPGITFAYHSAVAEQMVAQITSMRSAYATPQAPAAAAGRAADGPAAAASPADLDHIADELEKMDVLVGAMDRFTTKLRAGFVADGSDAAGDRQRAGDFWALPGWLPQDHPAAAGGLLRPDPGPARPGRRHRRVGRSRRTRSCARSR